MRLTLISMALLAGLLQGQEAGPPAPRVIPLFMAREGEGGPAFMVECRNTTGAAISTGSLVWPLARSAMRIDGVALEDQATMGPGLTMAIPSGATWRGIIELRQEEPRNFFAVALGSHVRSATVVPLQAGRHTIAVRCDGVWSADVPFYWER